MESIFEQLLYTTIRIECLDQNKNAVSMGTGFILQRPVGDDKHKLYIVSNKHVLCGAKSIAISFIRMKENEVEVRDHIPITINDFEDIVVAHPDPDIDVALFEWTNLIYMIPDRIIFKFVPYDILATFDEPELTVAQNVYFVGYPDDRYDKKNNLPLIRSGMIASHPKYDYNGESAFIIDAQVFPGSSGSPVFIDLTFENFKNGRIDLGAKNIKLLGVVSSTMLRRNPLKIIETGKGFFTDEILGLGKVYKSIAIKELVDSMPIDN